MKSRRDLMILLALCAVLILWVVVGTGRQQQPDFDLRPTSHSPAPSGTLALLRWMQDLGYDAGRLEYRSFTLSADDTVLVILNPSEPINRTDADEVVRWIEAGGTLIMADDQSGLFGANSALLRQLKVEAQPYEGPGGSIERAPAAQPLLDNPPVHDALVRADRVLELKRDDYAQLLGTADNTVLAGIRQGKGYIYLSSTTHPFTNEGLRDEQNVALMLNLLRRLPPGGRILFDEYHHGFFTPPSLRAIVLSRPWGWALLYALAVIAAYLILTGRRFGRPVPLREEVTRRSSAEYVESMADLFQRGDKRAFILRHYYTAFKRRLARPFGINSTLR